MSTLLTKLAADFTTQLAAAISIGGTTGTLLSQTDDDGNTLPDGSYVFTLDGSSSNKEYIRCTKTGTALTSIQSLSRQGALTSGVVRAHRIGASVSITDWAQLKYLTDLLSGATDLDSTDPLKYDGTATISDDAHLATKKYVDDTAIAGSPKATNSVYGITKLSVAAVSGTDPIAVGDNDTRVPTQDENNALVGTSGSPSSSNKYVTNDDTTGTGSLVRQSIITALPAPINIFGTGADGVGTISGNTTLTRDMHYSNLTVNSTFSLDTAGYRVYVSGTLTNNGTIKNNGSAGSTSSGGAGGLSGSLGGGKNGATGPSNGTSYGGAGGGGGGIVWIAAKTIAVEGTIEAKGGAGANGSNTGGSTNNSVGSAGTSSAKTLITTGTGGAGGQGSSSAGGSGGTVTVTTVDTLSPLFMTLQLDLTSFVALTGGAGGGSGGYDVPGGGSGGGGGGQGGVIFEMYQTLTTSGTKTVTGGAGGTGAGSGATAGASGSSGRVLTLIVS